MYARKQSKWVKIRKTYGHSVQVDMYGSIGIVGIAIEPISDVIQFVTERVEVLTRSVYITVEIEIH